MNMTNDGKGYGLTQYRWPLDYELAGRTLTLRAGERAYQLAFQDKEFVDCGGVLSQYQALKLDGDTHFAVFGETLAAAVLDLARGTAALKPDGAADWVFCRIDGFDEGDGTAPLPALTGEMAGTHGKWVFGCERFIELEYLPEGRCRCVWSPRTDRARTWPAQCVKLGEGRYLAEIDGTSPFRTDMPQGFSKLILVQDYDRLLAVGCIYSPTLNEFQMISGYGMEP